MDKIYSKVQPNVLLHIIFRKEDIVKGRTNVVPEDEFIQCSALNLDKDHTFPAHYHIWKSGERQVIAEESWVVIQGSVQCIFYDLNDEIIAKPILRAGDASFTLQGGHTYLILEDDTLVYEMKTGPYRGRKLDKEFII